MDEQRFDSLTRSLATGRSRRHLLRGLLGGVAAGLFARSAQTVEADSPRALRSPRAARAPRALRAPGRCGVNQSSDCGGACCPGDLLCFQDLGCHAADQTPCGGGSCLPGHICSSQGMCLPAGAVECGPGYCEGDSLCVNGEGCLPPGGTACGAGYCVGGQVCLNGQCERACDAGTSRCGQECVDTASHPLHCGGCGVTCASGQVCNGGVCSCPAGTERCGGQCVDPLTDPDHCGACDTACQATVCMDAACVDGQCQRTRIADCCTEDADCDDGNPCTVNLCEPETNTCGSVMVDEGDPCPADDNPCTYDICDGAGQCIHPPIEAERRVVCLRPDGLQGICIDGDCVVDGPGPGGCDASSCSGSCCGDVCTNLQTDDQNCGACGHICTSNERCDNGICTTGGNDQCPAERQCLDTSLGPLGGCCAEGQICCGRGGGTGQVCCDSGHCCQPEKGFSDEDVDRIGSVCCSSGMECIPETFRGASCREQYCHDALGCGLTEVCCPNDTGPDELSIYTPSAGTCCAEGNVCCSAGTPHTACCDPATTFCLTCIGAISGIMETFCCPHDAPDGCRQVCRG